MALRAAELEILYTANTVGVDQGEAKVKASAQRIESKPTVKKIDANASDALAGMDRVEAEAKKLVSERAVLQLDAEVSRAEKDLQRARDKVEDLQIRADAGFEVTADVKRAESSVARLEQKVDRLSSLRATVYTDADTGGAIKKLVDLQDRAKESASKAGAEGGDELGSSLVDALQAIPIAGGITLAGVAIGKAYVDGIRDGLQQEVGFDRLAALTGIDAKAALQIGRGAGEAYANVFGDSVEANMDTARLALQFNIIDGNATATEAKKAVEGIAGIADVMQEDVQPVARATAQLLRTGLAKNAQDAFDIIAAGQREGVNLSEDLLDTLSEYASTFKALGLTGGETLGLLNQGLKAGAPNTDFFATAIQELGIRIREGDAATAGFAQRLGLVPAELQKAFIDGGPAARDALDSIFDRLRDTDPIDRNAIAVGLLGTQFEDLQLDLSQLDLSNAESSLNGVQGAAQRMFDTLSDNDQSRVDRAFRNVEVAADAIKGALASVAADPIATVADFVSENRGPVLSFLSDLVRGSFDFGIALAESSASGAEGLGRLVSGPLATAVSGLSKVSAFFGRTEDAQTLTDLATEMRGFSDETDAAAGFIRDKLVPSLEQGKESVGGYLEGAVNMGYLNDASIRLADALDVVGMKGEGVTLSLEGVDLANLSASESGAQLERQLFNAAAALDDQLAAAEATGEGQDELTAKYNSTREALISQIEQMGIGRDAAAALVDEVLRTPESASTAFSSNAPEQQQKVQDLASRIETLPDGSVVIRANTAPADESIGNLFRKWDGATVNLRATGDGRLGSGILGAGYHGGVVDFMAKGGIPDLTPMSSIAAVIPANTWRVVGDRPDVAEAFIPLDGSPRSLAILAESFRRMPGLNVDASSGRGGNTITISMQNTFKQDDPTLQARALGRELRSALSSS